MKIYKYDLQDDLDTQQVMMPSGYKILKVGLQDGLIKVWALVEPYNNPVPVTFSIIGTGWELPAHFHINNNYEGTVQMGPFIWHIWRKVA